MGGSFFLLLFFFSFSWKDEYKKKGDWRNFGGKGGMIRMEGEGEETEHQLWSYDLEKKKGFSSAFFYYYLILLLFYIIVFKYIYIYISPYFVMFSYRFLVDCSVC